MQKVIRKSVIFLSTIFLLAVAPFQPGEEVELNMIRNGRNSINFYANANNIVTTLDKGTKATVLEITEPLQSGSYGVKLKVGDKEYWVHYNPKNPSLKVLDKKQDAKSEPKKSDSVVTTRKVAAAPVEQRNPMARVITPPADTAAREALATVKANLPAVTAAVAKVNEPRAGAPDCDEILIAQPKPSADSAAGFRAAQICLWQEEDSVSLLKRKESNFYLGAMPARPQSLGKSLDTFFVKATDQKSLEALLAHAKKTLAPLLKDENTTAYLQELEPILKKQASLIKENKIKYIALETGTAKELDQFKKQAVENFSNLRSNLSKIMNQPDEQLITSLFLLQYGPTAFLYAVNAKEMDRSVKLLPWRENTVQANMDQFSKNETLIKSQITAYSEWLDKNIEIGVARERNNYKKLNNAQSPEKIQEIINSLADTRHKELEKIAQTILKAMNENKQLKVDIEKQIKAPFLTQKESGLLLFDKSKLEDWKNRLSEDCQPKE